MTRSTEILILGAGWTSDFLIPLLNERGISFAATTRDGRPRCGVDTIQFQFNENGSDDDLANFAALPTAETAIITFPIKTKGASIRLVTLWRQTHPTSKTLFVQLGSTGIYDGGPTSSTNSSFKWFDRHSPFISSNARAQAEEELLSLSSDVSRTTVLNLCGLWGNQRNPRNWVKRVAVDKEALSKKGSVHFVHGLDVARCLLAVHTLPELAAGQRWIITDGRVYDWWDLASAWSQVGATAESQDGPYAVWVRELMREHSVRALPRSPETMGRALDSREFWETFVLTPVKARLDGV